MTKDRKIAFKSGSNLIVFREIGELQQYWEMQWKNARLLAMLKQARSEKIDDFEAPFKMYLPKDGIILEAGCGTGRIVAALQARGFTVEGIDYASETIARVQEVDQSLDVRKGDILAIDRPDGYYGGYVSLGVLEHEINGPQAGLLEAWRVLRPGGVALIVVPYLNKPRKRKYKKAKELVSTDTTQGFRFFQYQFELGYFSRILDECGFKVIEQIPVMLFEGLAGDYSLGRWLGQHNFFSWKISRRLKKISEHAPAWLKQRNSSMMLFVIKKRD